MHGTAKTSFTTKCEKDAMRGASDNWCMWSSRSTVHPTPVPTRELVAVNRITDIGTSMPHLRWFP
jgi:hypothetical protein